MNFVTVKSAFDIIKKEKEVTSGQKTKYVKLGEVSALIFANKKPKFPPRNWSFTGDWNKSVKPYYEGIR
jgi:hypothetical protein